jgi:hypothetical protein
MPIAFSSQESTTMPFTVRCSGCQTPLKVPDELQGKTVSCPSCKQAFRALAAPQAAPPAPPRPASQAVVRQEDNPFGFDEQERPSRRRDEDDDDRPRRSRRDYDDDDDRPRRSRRDYDEDYDDRPARRSQGGGNAKMFAILSIVFCCIPLLSFILAGVAFNQANTALKDLPRNSRYRTERQSMESAKVLATVGCCLAAGVAVVGVIMRITLGH